MIKPQKRRSRKLARKQRAMRRGPGIESSAIQELVAAGLVTIRDGQPVVSAEISEFFRRLQSSLPGWKLVGPAAKKLYLDLFYLSGGLGPGSTTTEQLVERGTNRRWIGRLMHELAVLGWIEARQEGDDWQFEVLDPPSRMPPAAVEFYLKPIHRRIKRIKQMQQRLEAETRHLRTTTKDDNDAA